MMSASLSVPQFLTLKERLEEIMQERGFSAKYGFIRSLGYTTDGRGGQIRNILKDRPVHYFYLCELAERLDRIPVRLWKNNEPLSGVQPKAFQRPLDYEYLRDGYIIDILRAERVASGMSQGELAEKIGVLRGRISNTETYRMLPKTDKISKFCEVFGLEAEWLAEPLVAK